MIFKSIAAAALAGSIASFALDAQAGPDEYIGQIFMTAANFCPRGTARADGQLLPISQNQALFSLLGTNYGGDGRTTFALPDLRGRVPVHPGTGPGLEQRQLGQKGGQDRQTLTQAQMPTHVHSVSGSGSASGSAHAAKNAHSAPSSDKVVSNGQAGGAGDGASSTTGAEGGGQSFSVLDPYLSVNFCVVTQGIFPSRS